VASELRGWQPDPYEIHEYRYFSDDGLPTNLVSDGARTFRDHLSPQSIHPPSQGPGVALRRGNSASFDEATEPDGPRSQSLPHSQHRPQTHAPQRGQGTPVYRPVAPPVRPSSEPLTNAQKIAYGVVAAVILVSGVSLAVVHLTGNKANPTSVTSTTSTSISTTTTTHALPVDLKASPSDAAVALVTSWASGNRASAFAVATPQAVATLFAFPYTNGLALNRGCSDAFSPIVCTYGPPGGAPPTDRIYQIDVSQTAGGWYVSSVKVNN
jgi:hypothetical protein